MSDRDRDMFCTKCGSPLEDAARFCTACGAEKDDCGVDAAEQAGRWDCGSVGCLSQAEDFGSVDSVSTACRPNGRAAERRANGLRASRGIIALAAVCVVAAAVAIGVFISPLVSGDGNSGNSSNLEETSNGQVSGVTDGDSPQKPNESSRSAQSKGFVLSDSDSRYYTESELRAMSLEELYYARNEIYARHGRGFKNADLAAYFKGKSWYVQRYEPEEFDAMPSPLNEYEKKNADLMLRIEQERDSSYLD